jgi:hypothetical protein
MDKEAQFSRKRLPSPFSRFFATKQAMRSKKAEANCLGRELHALTFVLSRSPLAPPAAESKTAEPK